MTTTTINDNLVKIDNVLTALNYLLEEVQTRKDELIKDINSSNLSSIVKAEMETIDFMNRMCYFIRNEYGSGITREVAFHVMRQIDSDIEAFINDRVNKALQSAGVNTNS